MTLKGWQRMWLIGAIILFPIVLLPALEERPTREQVLSHWASRLRMAVEQSCMVDAYRGQPPDRESRFRRKKFKTAWEEYRVEECGTYADMSDQAVISEVHARYRPYLKSGAVGLPSEFRTFAVFQPEPVLLSESNGARVAESIVQIDSEHVQSLSTLRTRQNEIVFTRLILQWGIPMAVWYAIGFSAQWWRPFIVQRRQMVGAGILILGAGSLVAGMMDSDSFAGGLGAMMLVGGFLIRKNGPGAPGSTR